MGIGRLTVFDDVLARLRIRKDREDTRHPLWLRACCKLQAEIGLADADRLRVENRFVVFVRTVSIGVIQDNDVDWYRVVHRHLHAEAPAGKFF